MRHGQGEYRFASETVYIGDWKEDKFWGKGKFWWAVKEEEKVRMDRGHIRDTTTAVQRIRVSGAVEPRHD